MSTVAVLGASGTLGRLLCAELQAHGHTAIRVSRADGVDVMDPKALSKALREAGVVVDCLNIETLSARKAEEFFTTAARNVAAAAPHLEQVVVLSILNVDDPSVQRLVGYYRAKHRQEQVYATVFGTRLSVVRTTQWFELGEQLRRMMRIGRLAFVPVFGTQPVAGRAVARLLATVIDDGPEGGRRELAGPERMTYVDLARAESHDAVLVPLPLPMRAARTGLLPGLDVPRDTTTLAQWCEARP